MQCTERLTRSQEIANSVEEILNGAEFLSLSKDYKQREQGNTNFEILEICIKAIQDDCKHEVDGWIEETTETSPDGKEVPTGLKYGYCYKCGKYITNQQ